MTVAEVADLFDELPPEVILPLHIPMGVVDGVHKYLEIKEIFRSHYMHSTPRFKQTEKAEARARFITIFYDNMFLVAQLERQLDILHDLTNLELYQDETKVNSSGMTQGSADSTNTTNTGQTDTRDLIDGVLTGASSASTMSTIRDQTTKVVEAQKIMEKSKDKYLDYLDPNARDITQTITLAKGTSGTNLESRGTGTTRSVSLNDVRSSTTSSNPMRDRIQFLSLEIPRLRERFLECFRGMFFNV